MITINVPILFIISEDRTPLEGCILFVYVCTVMFEIIYPDILLPHLTKVHAVWLIKSMPFFNFANH